MRGKGSNFPNSSNRSGKEEYSGEKTVGAHHGDFLIDWDLLSLTVYGYGIFTSRQISISNLLGIQFGRKHTED